MSKNNIILFQKYCENAIGKLSDECIDAFKGTKDDVSRIKLMYDTAKKISIIIPEASDKDIKVAENMKNEGNKLFARRDYRNALKLYDEGIIKCPQGTVKEREMLTVLISNRSAALFELHEYKRVFNDIDYLMEIGDYPVNLKYKIWLRKGKCYDELLNKNLACEAYNEALKCLDKSGLDEKNIERKKHEIERLKVTQSKSKPEHHNLKKDVVPILNDDKFIGGQEYIAATSKLVIEQDNVQGRYARATEDIPAGAIIVEENPSCSVVDGEHTLSNCQYCLTSVDQPIACPGCAVVVFCSTHCEKMANKSFHGVECGFQKLLFDCDASVNCLMAMRLISQRPIKFFRDKKNKLKDYLNDSCKKNFCRKKTYRSDDYDNVFFLCRHEHLRKKEELIHYACISIYLLRVLKYAKYFGDYNENVLTDDELFIGSLILRHLQLLQFNAHEISELSNTDGDPTKDIMKNGFENIAVGAGLYPTLSLFNHSCDPSIVRYNIKNKMVVRAIKPIKADDIIYENYGPLYMTHPIEKRQEELQKNYWFECLCQPCVELWPLFSEMDADVLRIPCKTKGCPFVFLLSPEDDPVLCCDYCNSFTNIYPHLKALMTLEQILPEAEHLLSTGQIKNATGRFVQALELLFKYSRAPHPDIVKVQQRLRMCLLHYGNRSCNYKPPFASFP
ncbi:SET and MYND domain-containing protein 4-like [Cylas formicarius]|uniref:SET and MYND domain-containing protein 4-like n=1 Tax=Cylas formicarius TaxID=197179 RepID=UPI002958BD77|nr:SET and MYND domain-containing protein 4-like [Cylas formicarius]